MMLSPDEAQLFYDLMWKLQYYVNQKQGVHKGIQSLEAYAHLPTELKLQTRDVIWKKPHLIDEYVQENPDALPDEKLEILRKWKGFIKGSFFIFRHLKKGSIFIGGQGDQVYSVQGLTEPLEEIVPSEVLPQAVETVLLPFKGRIIYDGLLSGYSVHFGSGIRSDLNREYSTARRRDRVNTTLEQAPGPAAPRKPRRSIAPQVEELIGGLERLKGDSPLQKSALALARLGLDVAASDARGSFSPEQAHAQERKLRRTATRLLNLLYDEEFDQV
jgi:hypothetical protein